MATEVEICNSAIAKVRGRRILTLDDDSTEARLCKDLYPRVRDRLLRSHPWNFAKRRAELGQLSETPAFEYSYIHQLPSDCLRLLETDLFYNESWSLEESGKIFSNSDTVNALYIAKITDTSRFDTTFIEALAYLLAKEIAYPLTQSATLVDMLDKQFNALMKETRTFNAQERGSIKQVEASEWIDERL
jgi:hypothetical protein